MSDNAENRDEHPFQIHGPLQKMPTEGQRIDRQPLQQVALQPLQKLTQALQDPSSPPEEARG